MTSSDTPHKETNLPNYILLNLALMLVYFTAGRLGLLLAVPPGYATPIWPPSGIALAAILIFGNRCWVGICLGSLLVNFSISYQASADILSILSMTTVIALGSTLQSLLGSYLVKRYVGMPNAFDGALSIMRFFLLALFVACLVAPTFSVSVLWLYKKVATDDVLWNWFTWWFGDVIGVLAMTPIMFVWFAKPRDNWISRRLLITLPTALLFILVIVVHTLVLKLDKERFQNDFEDFSKRLGTTVVTSVELNLRMAEAIGDFYNSSQFVERDEFREFTTRILKIYSFESLTWVKAATDGSFPVEYAEPQDKYEHLLGSDIGSNNMIKAALDQAHLSRSTAITEVVTGTPFFKHNDTRLISAYPVFDKNAVIMGYIVGLINFEKFIQSILSEKAWSLGMLSITDVTEPNHPYLLFKPNENVTTSTNPKLTWRETFAVANRLWRIDFWSAPDFVRKRQSWFIWGFLASAMLFVSLVEVSLLIFSGNSVRIERLVRARTQELKQTQEQLFQSQKLESLGNLAGGIAHDYNNILASIMGFGSMLRDRVAADEKSAGQADIIISSAERAAKLTQQLLGFARKGQYERKRFSLNDTVKQMVDILSATVPKNIDVKTNLATNLAAIEGDSNQIMQVLLNLGLNARDAMPKGGCITITTENYVIRDSGTYIKLQFSDTGEGVDIAIRDKIFDPFFTTKPQGKGTGLGLAMVYGIVKNHGGMIDMESSPSLGTTFSLYFPACR